MAESGQSKGKSGTPPKNGGGRTRKSPEHPAGGEPSDGIRMGWLALRYDIGGSWLFGGVPFTFPVVTEQLRAMDAPATDNVVIVVCPADLAEGLGNRSPESCKPVKGRLSELHLYEGKDGRNQGLLYEYLAAHPARSTEVEDWRKPISLPKA